MYIRFLQTSLCRIQYFNYETKHWNENKILRSLLLFVHFYFYVRFFSRYERLLRRAKTEDLTEVSGIGCLYQSGVDRLGRPVVVFIGKWFPFNKINLDKVCNFSH